MPLGGRRPVPTRPQHHLHHLSQRQAYLGGQVCAFVVALREVQETQGNLFDLTRRGS